MADLFGQTVKPKRRPRRDEDEMWDAVCKAFGIDSTALGKIERGKLNRAVADLKLAKAKPEEVAARRLKMQELYPGITITPLGLAGNWQLIGARMQAHSTARTWQPDYDPSQPTLTAAEKRAIRERLQKGQA